MNNKKIILIIIVIALIFSGLGFYLGSFKKVPASELIVLQEKLDAWEQAQEKYELLWFAHDLTGQVTKVENNVVYIKGNMLNLEDRTIYREVVVTENTNIILREGFEQEGKDITIEEIEPEDMILVSSQENIAANIRFEAQNVLIDRF